MSFDSVSNPEEMLQLLQRADVSAEMLERLSKNVETMKNRKAKVALVEHPQTPRQIALRLLRDLFTLELMQVTLQTRTTAEVKKLAEQALIGRLEGISQGEKLALARRGPGRVAGELLLDAQPRVMRMALENLRLNEAMVVKALLHKNASPIFVAAVCRHAKWSVRREVRAALLRNENTPLARALEIAKALPASLVSEILDHSELGSNVKSAIRRECESL